WKLYDLSGVHHVTAKDKEIFILVEKDYPLRKGLALMMISYRLQVENHSQMAEDLIRNIYNIANTPRKQTKDKEIFMLVEKDYPLRRGLALVMISYRLQVENHSQMAEDLIKKIYNIANTPRKQNTYTLTVLSQVMSTPAYVDSKTITQTDGAQSSRVPVPLPDDPYVAMYRGTSELILDTDSEEDELGDEDSKEDESLDADDKRERSDDEGHGLGDEDQGLDDESQGLEYKGLGLEEEAVLKGEQQAVLVV
nr:hypothetical protein [Tanacetum cinerariifolium]